MVDLIFSLAEIFIVLSFLFRDMLILRTLSCIGMAVYVAGALYSGLDEPGMKALMFFSGIAVMVNVVQITILAFERWPIALAEDLKEIYNQMFTSMTAAEFKKIYKLATVTRMGAGDIIVEEGKAVDNLIAIKSGNAAIIKDDKEIARIGPFYFIGEMSYLTGDMATATVTPTEDLICVSWKKVDLDKLEITRPDLYSKLKQDISINLIKKIHRPHKAK